MNPYPTKAARMAALDELVRGCTGYWKYVGNDRRPLEVRPGLLPGRQYRPRLRWVWDSASPAFNDVITRVATDVARQMLRMFP